MHIVAHSKVKIAMTSIFAPTQQFVNKDGHPDLPLINWFSLKVQWLCWVVQELEPALLDPFGQFRVSLVLAGLLVSSAELF